MTTQPAVNFDAYDESAIQEAVGYFASNAQTPIRTPGDFLDRLGTQFDGERKLNETLGYPETLKPDDFRAIYERGGIGSRIITLPAEDTWRDRPEIVDDAEREDDTAFEQAIEALGDAIGLFDYCHRVDEVAGIGRYGVLFLGFVDNQPFWEPIEENALSSPDDLAYMTPVAQDRVTDWDLDDDPESPRYQQPVTYDIDFGEISGEVSDIQRVHHSRIIHIPSDGRTESDLLGVERARRVYNRIQDWQKVVGGSAEMFWTGADRKFQFDVRDGYQDLPADEMERLSEDAKKLVHDLQPYIKTAGMDVNVLGGEDPNPSGIVEALQTSIAGATGIPKRILFGSERGELASSQDRANWFDTVVARQNNYAGATILRPLIDRLRAVGVLPDPSGGSYTVEWPDLFELTEEEQSTIDLNRAKTLKQLSTVAPSISTEAAIEYMETGEFPDDVATQPEIEPLDADAMASEPPTQQPPAMTDGGDDGA